MAHGFLNGSKYNEETSALVQIIERSITEMVIPVGTTEIGPSAFNFASKLTKLTIPEGVRRVSSSALSSMSVMKTIDLPLSCEMIASYGIQRNSNLESIRFGDTKEVQLMAFAYNSECVTYDFSRNTSVPTLGNTNAFDGINADAKILVPPSLYDEWIAATNWSSLAEYIVAAQ